MDLLFDAPSNSDACASMADLQRQLQTLLESKVTPTKAEHVSATFELRSNVAFEVPVTDVENASLEAGAGIDPRLAAGARASSAVTGNDGQLIRHINVIDTVLGQSQDDPVVQRIVSKYIMTGIGEADRSIWVMRSMTRGAQGWTFTYGCKDSAQAWARQHAKSSARTVVGEWSNKDGQDPVNLSRPAFDCRGTLTIAFIKSEKAISVKYEHTNMHRTVGELLELLAPPPPQPQASKAAEVRKSASKKTPKSKQQAADGAETVPGEEGVTPRPNKRKKSTQDGEPSAQKKRPRKKNNDGDAQADPALDMLPPEMPGARPVGDSAQRPLYAHVQQEGSANDSANGNGPNGSAYPQGLVGGEPFNGSEAQASAMVSSSLHAHSILNLPPGEAERRRETAIRLLAESNIDPNTLSPEQFSIFANQSPALQQDSLGMLIEYGAERLRIVLPEKSQNEAETSVPSDQDQSAEQSPIDDVQQQPTQTAESPKITPRATRTKNPEATNASVDDGRTALPSTDAGNRQKKPRAPRLRLSRGSCTSCRSLKLKCNKEKPSCDQCLTSGTACSYPFQQPRKSKASEQEVQDTTDADEAEQPVEQSVEQPAETVVVAANEDDEPEGLPSPGFTYEDPGAPPPHDPTDTDVEPESGPTQDNPEPNAYGEPSSGIYHHASGLTFPDTHVPDVTQQMWTSGAGTDYSQVSVHGSTNNGLSLPQQTQEPSNTLSFPEQTSTGASASNTATHHHQKSWGSYTSRRSGATDVPTSTTSASGDISHATTSWPAYSTPETRSTRNVSTSPRLSRKAAKPASSVSHNAPSVLDGMHQASALARAAMSTAAARPTSPAQTMQYEAAITRSGSKSRQGMRPQTRTPVPGSGSGRQSQSSAASAASEPSYSTRSDKVAAPSYSNNSYTQYSTTADQSSNGVAYQPYSQQSTATAASSSYPTYDSYNTRSHNSSNTLPLSNSATQQTASPYTSTTPSTTASWGAGPSSQTRNPLSYPSASSSSASPSVSMRTSTNQRSQLPSFSARAQAQTPSTVPSRPSPTTSTYSHNLPPSSYASYPPQPEQRQQHQQTGAASQQHQQGWYTGPSTSVYGTGTGGGGSRGGGGAHYGQQQHQHQHQHQPAQRAMNLAGRTYSSSSLDGGEQALYGLLPGGSGH